MLHDLPALSNPTIFRKKLWHEVKENLERNISLDLSTEQVAIFNRTLPVNTSLLDFRKTVYIEKRVSSPIHVVQVLSRHTCGVIYADHTTNLVKGLGLKVKSLEKNEQDKIVQVLYRALANDIDIHSIPIKPLKCIPISRFAILYQTSLCIADMDSRTEKKATREIRQFGLVLIICSIVQKDPSKSLLCECNALDEVVRAICQNKSLDFVEESFTHTRSRGGVVLSRRNL